jgi:hypothetical protein
MKNLIVNALANPEFGRGQTGPQRVECFALALNINTGGEQEITAENIVLIKQACEFQYSSPLVYGRICEFIG